MSRELKPLRDVMARAVAAARLSERAVERALGLPPRTWGELIAGRRILRVRHLLALARLLSVPPQDFFALALPEATQTAPRRLANVLAPMRPRNVGAQPATDLAALIRDAVRRELDNGSTPLGS